MATHVTVTENEGEGTLGQMLAKVDTRVLIQGKDMVLKSFATLKPWSEFGNSKAFSKPEGIQQLMGRITQNIRYFSPNYSLIFIGLIVYCLISSPMLLFAVAFVALGAAGIIHMKDKPPVNIGGRSLGTNEQGMVLACISLPLFFFASAGTVVFWLLGFSACIILGHAAMLDCTARGELLPTSDPWAASITETA